MLTAIVISGQSLLSQFLGLESIMRTEIVKLRSVLFGIGSKFYLILGLRNVFFVDHLF